MRINELLHRGCLAQCLVHKKHHINVSYSFNELNKLSANHVSSTGLGAGEYRDKNVVWGHKSLGLPWEAKE